MTHQYYFFLSVKTSDLFNYRRLLLILVMQFLWLIPSPATNIDSLRRLLPGSKGKTKVILLNKLAEAFAEDSTGKAFDYANEALKIAHSAGFRKEEANSLKLIADISFNLNDFEEAIKKFALSRICQPRNAKGISLSHNKVIVLTKGGKAQAVLTGSTNFSEGGIYGHSNVVHICEDRNIAAQYL